MTPAQYARHKEWMHASVRVTLSHLRNLWAVRDSYVVTDDIRADLIDLRERITWLIDRHSVSAASTSTASPNSGRSTVGFAKRIPSSVGSDSQTAAGLTNLPAAGT
jgi:hypothetical protein